MKQLSAIDVPVNIRTNEMVRSVYYSQDEILKAIMQLYCPTGIDLDPTYSKGNFYKNLPEPKYKSDIKPIEDVIAADTRYLPFKEESMNSIMFDPPFIIHTSDTVYTGNSNIIHNRFSSFKSIKELWKYYFWSMLEFYNLLKPNGVLIFKCQDIVDSSKQYLSHVQIIYYAVKIGFYPKDLFLLIANSKLSGAWKKQYHARKWHSYFLVFIKQKPLVEYDWS